VKRQKNDMADAYHGFVAVKSEARQAAAIAYHTRDLSVWQRTQTINTLRAHLAEQGVVAPAIPALPKRPAAAPPSPAPEPRRQARHS
jgi:transposase